MSTTRLRPLNDTIIIERDENITHEGLIKMPDMNSIEKVANTGTLVSWGEQCRYKNLFKPGMKVMFKQFGGCKFKHEGRELLSLIEEELLCLYD